MRTMRIELEGNAGHVAIERRRNSTTIRIDSTLREPKKEQAWMTWEIPVHTSDDGLFKIAKDMQRRCDGVAGTNSMIHDYLREIQRFQDGRRKDRPTMAKQTAPQLYDERREDIARVLDWLDMELDRHRMRAKANPEDWGCPGDLGHVREKLIETLAFVSNTKASEIETLLGERH